MRVDIEIIKKEQEEIAAMLSNTSRAIAEIIIIFQSVAQEYRDLDERCQRLDARYAKLISEIGVSIDLREEKDDECD